ncbi:hypothetical protein ET495_08975 [Xylanimonas allomyrinae]|uniref:Large extracellular alpha-helical protein n=1 Tax=Xylanimonas allomyrinae TaxID=2509459 RepID=A0A4P6ESH6_9MICO|nr:DUF5719 family protein [Xylanimonas allomyrinae]QAY63357.1 hypothetical protein ET495_08975 [Xylanimonas allomyrinae]
MARSFLRVLGATSTGVVVVGATAAAALFAGPWATALTGTGVATDPVRSVGVTPAPSLLACPPAAALPEGADVGDSQFSATPVTTTTQLAAGVLGAADTSAAWGALGGQPGALTAGRGAAVRVGDPGPEGSVLQAQPVAEEAFRAAGATASVTTGGDLRGLAAAPCTAPAISQWIVGGGTEVGSTAVLTVQNPSQSTATVALDVFGPSGQVALGSQGTFVLGPGQSSTTRIEAVAPDQRRVAVHVTSTGARVAASLQVQRLDGLVPQGVDILTPGAAPATSVAVPGLLSAGETLDDPRAPVLRILAPGESAGTAHVTIYGADGIARLRGAETVDLQPGAVIDLPLGGLAAGGYGIVIDADVPVVAAASFSRSAPIPADAVVQGQPYDIAWVSGQPLPEPGQGAQAALPGGTSAVVSLTAVPAERGSAAPAGTAKAVVRVYGADGTALGEKTLTVHAGTVARVAVGSLAAGGTPALVSVDAAAGAQVAWAVELTAEDGSAEHDRLVASIAPTASVPAPGAAHVREVDVRG